MKFKYQAKTIEGESQVGVVDASNRETAANILAGHNLFILSLEESEKIAWYEKFSDYLFGRFSRKDLVIFTRQLSMLLEARVPLNTSLKTLCDQTVQPVLKEAALQVSEDIDAGLSLSQSMERQPHIFSGFFSSMVRSAEVTGNIESVMGFLADYLEREYALRQKTQSALIYPAILIGLFGVVAFILVAFVIPQIGPIFSDAGVNLPVFTMIIMGFGMFIGKWWPVIIFGALVIFMMAVDYFQTPEGKSLKDELKINLPIIKKIYFPLTITRIANSASMLLKGGVPIIQALEIIGETSDNVIYQEIMHKVADDVRQGQTLSSSISKYPDYFPASVTQIISVGEAAGQLEKTFSRISSFYGREADIAVDNIVELIQPALIVSIGVLVGLLFSSVLLPIYQLIGTIS